MGGRGGTLARVVENKIEASYARSHLLERRREVMEAWRKYVSPDSMYDGPGTT